MTDYRIEREGARLDYTCENRRYYTNTGLGEMHTPHSSRGSVLPEPLVRNPNGSLWLEHVSDRKEAALTIIGLCGTTPTDGLPFRRVAFSLARIWSNMQRLLANFIPPQ